MYKLIFMDEAHILHCFVRQQKKAHVPTLNMPFLHKVQFESTPNACFLTLLQCFV